MWEKGKWSDRIINEILSELSFTVEYSRIFFSACYQYEEGQSRRLLDRLMKLRCDISIHFDTVVQPNNFW